MCGIFAAIDTSASVVEKVMKGLLDLEYRGYDSWGIAMLKGDGWTVKKRVGKVPRHHQQQAVSQIAFGHTRWATHGIINRQNAHPHLDCPQKIAIVHNGIVENYEQLRTQHLSSDHSFHSQTDSEIIAHLIESYYENTGDFVKSCQACFQQLGGNNAVVAALAGENMFVAYKNGSPLILGSTKNSAYIASDAWALSAYMQDAVVLGDGEMAIVKPGNVRVFKTHSSVKVKSKRVRLRGKHAMVSKGEYAHFMLKEIHDQINCLLPSQTQKRSVSKVADELKQAEKCVLVGCGSAYHAALIGVEIAREFNVRAEAYVPSDLVQSQSVMHRKDCIVALSQSGETMDLLECMRVIKSKVQGIYAVVNVEQSSLHRIAKQSIMLECGTEKAVATTKAFLSKIIRLFELFSSQAHQQSKAEWSIELIHTAIKQILEKNTIEAVKKCAKMVQNVSHLYILGKGTSYVSALEMALKIKEVAYIHAEAFRISEFKHGPIALIENNSVCLVLAPDDQQFEQAESTASQLKTRGAKIIGISSRKSDTFDFWLPVPNVRKFSFIPEVVVGQLLAYSIAVSKGIDPDMPRNLAKSVTVI